jgi:hypothetical protein
MPLRLINHHNMKACWEAELFFHAFLTPAIERVRGHSHILGPYSRKLNPSTDFIGDLLGPTRIKTIPRPCKESIPVPQLSGPQCSHCVNWAALPLNAVTAVVNTADFCNLNLGSFHVVARLSIAQSRSLRAGNSHGSEIKLRS